MDLEKIILSYLMKNQKQKMILVSGINDQIFSNKMYRKFYRIFLEYDGQLDEEVYIQLLKKKIKSKKSRVKMEMLFIDLENTFVDRQKYETALTELKENKIANDWIQAQNDSIDLVMKGDITGAKEILMGTIIKQDFHEIESTMDEGSARLSAMNIYDRYVEVEKGDNLDKQRFYFDIIDKWTKGGIANSELGIVGAYTGQGKSEMLKEFAYRIAVNGGTVVIGSGEMKKLEFENRIICRHIHKFYAPGFKYDNIEMGKLDNRKRKYRLKGRKVTAKKLFEYTCKDWAQNPKYGDIYIFPFKRGMNAIDVYRKFKMYEKISLQENKQKPGLFIIDSIQHLKPVQSRKDKRVEVDDILFDVKQLCLLTDWKIMGSWWMSRSGFNDACKKGYYELGGLSESAGIERTVNISMWLLQDQDMMSGGDDGGTINRILFGINKFRRGKKRIKGVLLYEDFSSCIIDDYVDDDEGGEES